VDLKIDKGDVLVIGQAVPVRQHYLNASIFLKKQIKGMPFSEIWMLTLKQHQKTKLAVTDSAVNRTISTATVFRESLKEASLLSLLEVNGCQMSGDCLRGYLFKVMRNYQSLFCLLYTSPSPRD